jgi:hypothetical protein
VRRVRFKIIFFVGETLISTFVFAAVFIRLDFEALSLVSEICLFLFFPFSPFSASTKRIEIGADAFNHKGDDYYDESRTYKKIYYNPGSAPPVVSRAPGIGGDLFPMLQYIEKDMMDIAGLHDVSQGMAPAGTPAEAVQLLQRADNTQHSYVRADIEISAAKIKEWEIALVEQFGVAPFIGNVDQESNPY